jgi:hypothetical protein
VTRQNTIRCGLILLCLLMSARAQARPQGAVGSLAILTSKTGWIHLGYITADRQEWAIGSDPHAGFTTGTYEIVGSSWDRRAPRLPRVGERIRLTVNARVMILDYLITGEKRLMDPPIVNRPLRDSDSPGIRLPAGTVLEVRSVKVSKALGDLYGGIRSVWARIVAVSN